VITIRLHNCDNNATKCCSEFFSICVHFEKFEIKKLYIYASLLTIPQANVHLMGKKTVINNSVTIYFILLENIM
jgi:hypothetical protein